MPDPIAAHRHARGLLDTSVLIDPDEIAASRLPSAVVVGALSLAELAAGVHAADESEERGRRLDRLQRAEAAFDPLPFDGEAARAYGRIFAAVTAAGRQARGARSVDLLIAATALSQRLPLYTRDDDDFRALDGLVEVVVV